MLLCLSLHLLAPPLQPLGFIVKELHEPAAVPANGGHSARVSALQTGFNQPGFRVWAGRPAGGPVVLPVTEQALRAHRADSPVLRGRAGLRVPPKGSSELETFVLHGWKALQLHVCLHGRGHAVGALEPPVPESQDAGGETPKKSYFKYPDLVLLSEILTVFDPRPGSRWNGTEEGLSFLARSLSPSPPVWVPDISDELEQQHKKARQLKVGAGPAQA